MYEEGTYTNFQTEANYFIRIKVKQIKGAYAIFRNYSHGAHENLKISISMACIFSDHKGKPHQYAKK